MISTKSFLLLTVVAAEVAGSALSMQLGRATIEPSQEYGRGGEIRTEARLNTDKPFLWIDERHHPRLRVRPGEIVVVPGVAHGPRDLPRRLIYQ